MSSYNLVCVQQENINWRGSTPGIFVILVTLTDTFNSCPRAMWSISARPFKSNNNKTWDSEHVWGHPWVMYLAHGSQENWAVWGNFNDNEFRKQMTSSFWDASKLCGGRSRLLPQQKASHQGLDLITAQQGERPSRQQSCPPAFHPLSIDAPCRLTQERPSLTPPPSTQVVWRWEELRVRGGTAKRRRGRWNPGCSLWTVNHCV